MVIIFSCIAFSIDPLFCFPELGRSPGGGNGYPLQYSCLENFIERGTRQATVLGVTKSQMQLSTHKLILCCTTETNTTL